MTVFRNYLLEHDSPRLREQAGVESFEGYDHRELVRRYATTREEYLKKQHQIPLYQEFVDCQLQRAAENTRQLGELAAQIVEHPITLSANTGLPSLIHTVVTPYLTYLVAEVNHRSSEGAAELLNAVQAYRMAEAIGKPIAATAAGHDWAFGKANGCEELVRIWIALSYACGQRLMVPHRMWCHTPELGTHWYDGPTEAYAPLYRFVRSHSELFRDCTTVGPLAAPKGIPDRFGTHAQRQALKEALAEGDLQPLSAGEHIWCFPRIRSDGALLLHLVNLDYDATKDTVHPQRDVSVEIDLLFVGDRFTQATLFAYDAEPSPIPVTYSMNGSRGICTVCLPEQRLWSVVLFT